MNSYLIPEWPKHPRVNAFITTRPGGYSKNPFDSFNLADHVNDKPSDVLRNRLKLMQELKLPQPPSFLSQVHGICSLNLDLELTDFTADACYTTTPARVCAVLTADCLPLLVRNADGTEVAAIHAGWRGLLAGVIDSCIKQFQASPTKLQVYLGPAIGPCHFEVGEDMRRAYREKNPEYEAAFSYRKGQVFADLYQLAKINLKQLSIQAVYQSPYCTECEAGLFYSHRRDQGNSGRFASLIWIGI